MYSGAKGLLVSHWSVDSVSTQELMTETFQQLKAGNPVLGALNTARKLIASSESGKAGSKISRSHPYFWAPFVYVGD
jgi:CHAT domain-containing protein